MKRRLFIVSLLMAGAAWARVGETEAQLVARFGPPVSRSKHIILAQGKVWELGPTLSFQQEDWSISCDLVDGRVVRESYGKRGDWTEEHVQTVLNANAQGVKWTETTARGGEKMLRTWKRSDGATARWVLTGGMMVVVPAYDRAKEIVEAKAKAETRQPAKI